jgi:uncharacterized membrane protein
MFESLLFLHVIGAIVAFGFGFAAPVFGRMLAAGPQHAPWYLRAVKRVSDVVIVPAALSMAITGVGLVATGAHRFEEPWLALSLVIYIAELLATFLVQRPTLGRLIELTATPPGPGGPPAEVPALSARLRLTGYALSAAVVVIVFLMVVKPGV